MRLITEDWRPTMSTTTKITWAALAALLALPLGLAGSHAIAAAQTAPPAAYATAAGAQADKETADDKAGAKADKETADDKAGQAENPNDKPDPGEPAETVDRDNLQQGPGNTSDNGSEKNDAAGGGTQDQSESSK
jgi:hypothetical protein